MNYMSVCSGVEAASLAWEGLGWNPVAFSEIEPFPCAVLAERFPGVPNLGDMTKIEVRDDEIHGAGFTVCRRDVDLLVGGTPCQSFSVAGRREGLKGASGLAFHFVRLLREIQPKWFVWENVPGALSSRTDGQLDFNFLVGAFAECGYGLAWRILDAQYVRSKSFPFAIPQRRRRLFVVGCLGDEGARAGKVLFDGESLSGDTPPRRTTTQGASGCAERSIGVSIRTAHTRANGCGIGAGTAHTLGASDVDAVWWDGSDKADTLTCTNDSQRMPDKGRLQCVIVPAQNPHDSTCVFTKEAHPRNSTDGQAWRETDIAKTLNTFCTGETRAEELIVGYDNHSQDSRVKETGGVSPTLTSRLGTGGGNTPLVQDVGQTMFSKTARPTEAGGCKNFKETGVAYGINCQASLMHPFSKEVSQVLSVSHQSGVVRDECVPIDMINATRDADKMDDINRHGAEIGKEGSPAPTVTENQPGFGWRCTVRRLLPMETERLMGFPDNWTRIPWRGKPEEQCPDGPRYKACGNSMCVNCMEWIGERIEMVERELQER